MEARNKAKPNNTILLSLFCCLVVACCVPCNTYYINKNDLKTETFTPLYSFKKEKINRYYRTYAKETTVYYTEGKYQICYFAPKDNLPWDTTAYGYFKNGYKIGEWKYNRLVWKDGSINMDGPNHIEYTVLSEYYCKGWLHGQYMVYDTSGAVLYKTRFRKGTGYQKNYSLDARLLSEGQLKKHQKVGKWLYYDSTTTAVDTVIWY